MSFNRNIDVLFVVPSFAPQLEQESIGTLILAKIAQLARYNIKVVRYWEVDNELNKYDSFAKRMVDYIRNLSPKIVCFYCRNNDYHICIDISRRLKSNLRSCIIVFGGPQADLVAELTLRSFPFVDFVCCGEGEHTIIPTISYILQGKSVIEAQSIPGLVYRKDLSTICKNKLPRLIENGYRRSFYYYDLIPDIVFENSSSVGIDIGRGCPFSCTFCSTKTFWKQKYRLREIDDILDEIEFVHNKYGIKLFSFEHDLFTLDKHKVFEFCSKLISRKITIKWNCSSRIDTIDREMIDVMVKSGLSGIYFGIESGSPKNTENNK